MNARFLLGPAGSGKTFRCLAEIRDLLKKNPEGAPILFLAPKQATFQLERQLLADDSVPGFARLQILSFERLARFIFEGLNFPPPRLLSDEGRVMVLRALLLQHESELKLFRKSARRPGFAEEMGRLLRELQQNHVTAAKLRALAHDKNLRMELREKLGDLALLQEGYSQWFVENGLQNADCLLDLATDALGKNIRLPASAFRFSALYLDGFAEMTPQELDLLAAILPFCEDATLAFCLDDSVLAESETSWLSLWNTVRRTFEQCRQRVENTPGAKIETKRLPDNPQKTRFSNNPELARLEGSWARGAVATSGKMPEEPAGWPPSRRSGAVARREGGKPALQVFSCSDPEAEAVLAAREILKFVRAGNRFRDCAILVRDLEQYHKPLARTFRRYGIPFFLDRRESVAHHPLAELTRGALRMAAYDWRHDDFFSALKAGFCAVEETEIDRLENAALEFGWRGEKWREPLPDASYERLRKKILPPFENFYNQLAKPELKPNGKQMAGTIRRLWDDLDVEKIMEKWSTFHEPRGKERGNGLDEEIPTSPHPDPLPRGEGTGEENRKKHSTFNIQHSTHKGGAPPHPLGEGTEESANDGGAAIHSTVLEQMNALLDDLELGFAERSLPLRDWLPIIESGLVGVTIGVIPPVLDEVLIGAIDRARNPDLKFTLVLGINESVFPATPTSPAILTETDRAELPVPLGPDLRQQVSRERFYGYIAFTRSSEKLTLAFSRSAADGTILNPSAFLSHLQRIFPRLSVEEFQNEIHLADAENTVEIVPLIFDNQKLGDIPGLGDLTKILSELREPDPGENLSPPMAAQLYGPALRTSVSRLEEFAACPFRFFVRSGLRAEERKVFELDARERGSFQHDLLKRFHEQVMAENKRWRDLKPQQARERISQIAEELIGEYRSGLLNETARSRFAARAMTESLQDFVAVTVSWLREQNEFDPVAAELGFGAKDAPQTAWEIGLDHGQKLALTGRIDRVDLCQSPDGRTLAIVMDYKSSQKKLDAILVEHGIQLQLLAYLNVLRHWKNPQEVFGVNKLVPAGVFYVNLRGQFENGDSRDDVLGGADESEREAYRHAGRFDAGALEKLDTQRARDQFSYRIKSDGTLHAGTTEALAHEEFVTLLDRVEIQLREFGNAIYSGLANVNPYRKGKQTPCEYCDYASACRIDPWTHKYRVLD